MHACSLAIQFGRATVPRSRSNGTKKTRFSHALIWATMVSSVSRGLTGFLGSYRTVVIVTHGK